MRKLYPSQHLHHQQQQLGICIKVCSICFFKLRFYLGILRFELRMEMLRSQLQYLFFLWKLMLEAIRNQLHSETNTSISSTPLVSPHMISENIRRLASPKRLRVGLILSTFPSLLLVFCCLVVINKLKTQSTDSNKKEKEQFSDFLLNTELSLLLFPCQQVKELPMK